MFALLIHLSLLGALAPQYAPLDLTAIGVDPFEPDRTLARAADATLDGGDRILPAPKDKTLAEDASLGLAAYAVLGDATLAVFPADAGMDRALFFRPAWRGPVAALLQFDGSLVRIEWRDATRMDHVVGAAVFDAGRVRLHGDMTVAARGAGAAGDRIVCWAGRIVHPPGLPE